MKLTIAALSALLALFLLPGPGAPDAPPDVLPDAGADARFADAERFYAEGSYARALELYRAVDVEALEPAAAAWVRFRRADAAWRADAATSNPDPTAREAAREALERMLEERAARDPLRREIAESLGDFWWTRRGSRNAGMAFGYYQVALDHWAGSTDLERAREAYLALVFKMAAPPEGMDPRYGWRSNQVPVEILERALRVAERDADRARLHFLLALARQHSDERGRLQARRHFEEAVARSAGLDFRDDVLFAFAQWLESNGTLARRPDGGATWEPDFPAALELYRRLLAENARGETPFHDAARDRVREIESPRLDLGVAGDFLPGSEVEYVLRWRNVSRVELALQPLDLTSIDLRSADADDPLRWPETWDAGAFPRQGAWTLELGDASDRRPRARAFRLAERPGPGAYLLRARAGEQRATALVLVTRLAITVKHLEGRSLIWVTDALTGEPADGATFALWESESRSGPSVWTHARNDVGVEGLVRHDWSDGAAWRRTLVFARDGDQQTAVAFHGRAERAGSDRDPWSLYAWADRPAYRPGETAGWKLLARRVVDARYVTPERASLDWEIRDPRGDEVASGRLALNEFGGGWETLAIDPTWPLGEYTATFREPGENRALGGATLFRVEEYKLPEFTVAVEFRGDANGDGDGAAPPTFRTGDEIVADVVAEYTFGGPVGGAEVEAVVRRRPWMPWWRPPVPFPWLSAEPAATSRFAPGRGPGAWGGEEIHRETRTTGADGRATVRFATPFDSTQDWEYTVEARVVDRSRREVRGEGSVRVTRQDHFAFLHPERRLVRPGDEAAIAVRTENANGAGVPVEGELFVVRQAWDEIWVGPDGRELEGDALAKERRRRGPGFPELADGWRLERRERPEEAVLRRTVRTGADGSATATFAVERAGVYRVRWRSADSDGLPVEAETAFWASDRETRTLAASTAGLELVYDPEAFRAGRTAPLLVTAQGSGRWVLLSTVTDAIDDVQVIRLDGDAKLVEIAVDARHVPNFLIDASATFDGRHHGDRAAIAVAPDENVLDLALSFDRTDYRPGDEGRLTLVARDSAGEPVEAELGLALIDASIFAIQEPYAPDPRAFFFGRQRPIALQTDASLDQRRLLRIDPAGDRDVPDATEEGEVGLDIGTMTFEESRAKLTYREQIGRSPAPQGVQALAAEQMAADQEIRQGGAGAGGDAVQVRSDFRSTILWLPGLRTGKDGRAEATFAMPDSLTTWRATARGSDRGDRVGIATAEARSNKPLIARLQTPRFLVAGDRATISAVLNNTTDATLSVRPELTLETGTLRFADGSTAPAAPAVEVPAGGEVRVDWTVEAHVDGGAGADSDTSPGDAVFVVRAVAAGGVSDGMRRAIPLEPHGIDKLLAESGRWEAETTTGTVRLDLPAARRKESTELTVRLAPSLASTMLDALPYLVDYPYGCTEQTMSRFLPSAIVAKTLADLGLDADAAMGRAFGGIEPQHAKKTQPGGKKNLAELDRMTREGLARLVDMQHADGGWGWWKEGDSDPWMTAYVVQGLALADGAGVDVPRGNLARAAEWLARELVAAENRPDLQAWMLHAVAAARGAGAGRPTRFEQTASDNLWAKRDALSAYGRALYALAAHARGEAERAATLARNLENGAKLDRASTARTARWGADGFWWRWQDSPVETTASVLRALLAIDPDHDLVQPAALWLVKNRRGAQWSNTRDTAIAVLALNDYLKATGEAGHPLDVEIAVNGEVVARKRRSADEALGIPVVVRVPAAALRDGRNDVRVTRRAAGGPLYYAVEARFFSLEEPVTPAGNELHVRREYARLVPQQTLLDGVRYRREPLADGAKVESGDRVEVVLTIETKNDYEYLLFEDLKPAGFEAVEVTSGGGLLARELTSKAVGDDALVSGPVAPSIAPPVGARREASILRPEPPFPNGEGDGDRYTGRARPLYRELRDRNVALFADALPQGVWEIRYELRAETPGRFHALPLLGEAMYVPEIRANGSELRVEVEERPAARS